MDRALAYAVMKASPPFQWREKPLDKSTDRRRTVKSVGLGNGLWVFIGDCFAKNIQNLSIIQI